MSAKAFELHFGEQETVRLSQEKNVIYFKINNATVITVNLYTGRCALHNPPSIKTLQKKNCFNRFFELTKASRYIAQNTDEGLVVSDRYTGAVIQRHATKINLTLPVISIWVIAEGFDYGECLKSTARNMRNQHYAEIQERAEAAKQLVIPQAVTPDQIPF